MGDFQISLFTDSLKTNGVKDPGRFYRGVGLFGGGFRGADPLENIF